MNSFFYSKASAQSSATDRLAHVQKQLTTGKIGGGRQLTFSAIRMSLHRIRVSCVGLFDCAECLGYGR